MNISADIVVVGAGAAGTLASAMLGRQGSRVILVDPRPSCAPIFKAEKIERDQVRLLRKFGLLEHLMPYTGRVREVQAAYNGRVFRVSPIEQYGFAYADMVNALRTHLPATVTCKLGHVQRIVNNADIQRVQLAGGEELTSRLVVLACGISHTLQTSLGLNRRVIQKDQCFVFGFNVAASKGQAFDFDAVTYYPTTPADRIDYLTLFNLPQTMRANLFVFRSASDPWVRRFLQEPESMLGQAFPKLTRVIGEYRMVSKIDSGCVDLYSMDGAPQPGVVLIGDAYQSACPATGLGLYKILTDVDVLSECIPFWLATPGIGLDKLSRFYNHPRKRSMDLRVIRSAIYQRRAAFDRSLRWRIHRLLLHLKWRFNGRDSKVLARG
jgi:2-polyprenyl-6-methoxyphenol hydroxylase-like FAD-dependent oxidoreductase